MNPRFRAVFSGSVLLVLSACASLPADESPATFTNDMSTAQAVLSAGYTSIIDKYIDQVPLRTVTVESLRGLAAIDPALTIEQSNDEIIIRRHNREIAADALPASDDTAEWAALAAQLTREASDYSPDLRHANSEAVYQALFDGALAELDVYSRYAGAEEADRNRANRDGFGGVGVRFRIIDGHPVVTDLVAGSPADESGIAVGDEIVSIGGHPVVGLSVDEIVAKLRGAVRSKVQVAVRRTADEFVTFNLERTHIVPPTVSATNHDGVVHIRVKSFNQGTAQTLANTLAEQVNNAAVAGVVLDLRGNPGGLLRQSIEVADAFLSEGDILDTFGRHPDSIQHYEAAGRDFAGGLPMVVLIDGRSASAAEIVAAALQDTHRAVIIGTASYGKGTVQTVVRLPNNGEITLTWSRFIAPSGYALHGLGVYPVVCMTDIAGSDRDNILAALDRQPETTKTLSLWRSTDANSLEARRELRSQCPPARRAKDADLEIAAALINDASLYDRALQIATLADRNAAAAAVPETAD
ncbi:MAG: S41 family peptidase [Rhodospirillales bacterium]